MNEGMDNLKQIEERIVEMENNNNVKIQEIISKIDKVVEDKIVKENQNQMMNKFSSLNLTGCMTL